MDSDEEELAELRHAGALRGESFDASSRAKLEALRQRQEMTRCTSRQASRRDQERSLGRGAGPYGSGSGRNDKLRGPSSLASHRSAEEPDEDAPVIVGEDASLDSDALRGHFPLSFSARTTQVRDGGAASKDSLADALKSTSRSQRPLAYESDDRHDEDEDDDDEEEGGEGAVTNYRLPTGHEVHLKGHAKVVTALDIERSGNRLVSGSHDFSVHLYDFQGMTKLCKPFRTLSEPCGGNPIVDLSFSPNGENFLIVPATAKPKIYNRDGKEVVEFERGDMYIRDMKQTKGHITAMTSGKWHPTERNEFLTASEDGTLRVWDTYDDQQQKIVIKPQLDRPGRIAVTSCDYSPSGELVVGGLRDGSIQIWSLKSKLSAPTLLVNAPTAQLTFQTTSKYISRPKHRIKKAHNQSESITCTRFMDEFTIVSRAEDDTTKIWDIRNLKDPIKVFEDMPVRYAESNCGISPDGNLLLIPTGCDERDVSTSGKLHFIDTQSLDIVQTMSFEQETGSIVRAIWHPKINQILLGCGGRRAGMTSILFDPRYSERGALMAVGRAPRKADSGVVNVNMNAVVRSSEFKGRKRERERMRKDPIKSQKPDDGPMLTSIKPGGGGKLGITKGSLLKQYIMKKAGQMDGKDEDARAMILRHADEAAKSPMIFGTAYAKTQPKPIFSQDEETEEEEKKGQEKK